MRVRALQNFSGPLGSYTIGQEFDLPDGVDWLAVGYVEIVEIIEQPEPASGSKSQAEPKAK